MENDNNYRALALSLPYVECARKKLEDKVALLHSMILFDWAGYRNLLHEDGLDFWITFVFTTTFPSYTHFRFTIEKTCHKNEDKTFVAFYGNTTNITIYLVDEYGLLRISGNNGSSCGCFILTHKRADEFIAYIDSKRE